MKNLFAVVLILGSFAAAFAQVKKFRWTTELCQFEGTYNARKFSEARLRNTLKLFSPVSDDFRINTDATVWKFEDIAKLKTDALDREYEQKSAQLKKMQIVASPYFEALRQKKLKELEQIYQLSRTTMTAYANPAVIREYKRADACVAKFAAPLINGGGDLLGIWRAVNEDSRRNNSDPQRLERIFNEQMNSADRLKFALTETMSFGWWNCANNFIEHVETDGTAEKEFDKLFTRVKTVYCDEP